MKMHLAALALLIAGATGPVSAHQMTVGDLQEICTARDQGNKKACQFYILGVTEGASTAAGVAEDKAHFCIPGGITASAMEFATKKAIGEDLMFYPADRDLAAAGFVAAVMQKSFPCHTGANKAR
jgi:hypothetical protein